MACLNQQLDLEWVFFTRYMKKEGAQADDDEMSIEAALMLINSELDEFLNNLHGDFDVTLDL